MLCRPVLGHGQGRGTAAGVPAIVLPATSGIGEVAVGPQALAVCGEPLVEPGPGSQECLVGNLGGIRVGSD